jgi:predicted transcriptional regulator
MRYNGVMSNNPRFLDLFNHLDESCRARYHLEDRTSSAISFLSAKLAHSSSKKDNDLAESLDAIRQLRNTLVHVEKVDGEELAEVNPKLLEDLETAIRYVENPPRALASAIPFSHLFVVGLDENLGSVLAIMMKRGFSHVPVIDNGGLLGVYSEEVLTSYLIAKGSVSLSANLKMRDFLAFLPMEKHPNERYIFMARDALLEDAREAFADSKTKTGKRLAMIFISEHGRNDETILGALVPSALI